MDETMETMTAGKMVELWVMSLVYYSAVEMVDWTVVWKDWRKVDLMVASLDNHLEHCSAVEMASSKVEKSVRLMVGKKDGSKDIQWGWCWAEMTGSSKDALMAGRMGMQLAELWGSWKALKMVVEMVYLME